MRDDFRAIKDRIDLVDLVLTTSGGKIAQRRGEREVKINPCPFCGHNDCFTVYNEERRYHCFSGTCGANGDCYDYISFTQGVDNWGAIRFLAEKVGYDLPERRREGSPEGRSTKSPDSKHRIWSEAVAYYLDVLLSRDEKALNYQTVTRGHSVDLLRSFGVGFSDGGLHRHLKGKYSEDDLVQSGLVKRTDGRVYDHFGPGMFVYPHNMSRTKGWNEIGDWTGKAMPGTGRNSYRLEAEYRDGDSLFYNQPALYSRHLIVCEGQNDLLSLVGKGGHRDVIATTGQLSDAQIAALAREAECIYNDTARDRITKRIYLCFDRDAAGDKYSAKIEAALNSLLLPPRVQDMVPDKPFCNLNRIVWYSVHKDIDEYLSAIDESDESDDGQGPARALERLARDSTPIYQPLDSTMGVYRSVLERFSKDGAESFYGREAAKTQAEIMFDWIGGRRSFFVDRADSNNVCFSHGGEVYRIDKKDTRYSALIYRLMKVTHEESRGKIMSAVLSALAHNEGRVIDVVNWFHQDADGALLIHSARRDEAIIRIAAGEVSILPNGQSCLMRPSPQMHPVDYRPNVQPQKVMAELKRLVMDNLPCSPENRYFVMGWMLYTWLIGLSRDRPLLHVTGDSASGKTTLANLVAALVYGNDEVTVSTVAAMWSDGSMNPVVMLDNLENAQITPHHREFLLAAATGAEKHKRSFGTNTGSYAERLNCQVMITSIEPLAALKEMNNRLWAVECDKRQWGAAGFNKINTLEAVKALRGDFISAWLQIVAKEILPTWGARKKHWLDYLALKQNEVTKERMTEYFAGLLVILETLLRYMPDERRKEEHPEIQLAALVKDMFESQRALSDDADTYANPIVTFLHTLSDHLVYADKIRDFQKDFKIKVVADRRITEEEFPFNPDNYGSYGFRGTPTQFHAAFSSLAKQIGCEWPYKSVIQFGARMKDSETILARAGWTVEQRRVGGDRHYIITRAVTPDEEKPQGKLI